MKTAGFPTEINDLPAMMCSTAVDLTSLDNWNPLNGTYSINKDKLPDMTAQALCNGSLRSIMLPIIPLFTVIYSAGF